MTDLPEIGALWIGGRLTWLEQLCLKSFVDRGHKTILYTYSPVQGIPEGVEERDGRKIVDTDDFITHTRTESVALFSDYFRFHLVAKRPGLIYVDTDVYCYRPFELSDPFVFGYEIYHNPKRSQLNGAVLRLPPESALLARMLEFMEDLYPRPLWLGEETVAEIDARRAAGDPMHVGEMKWGVWGPLGVTALARETGEISHALPTEVFYPVHFRHREIFFHRPKKTRDQLTERTLGIHLWAPIKKLALRKFDGVPPEGTFLSLLLAEHGISAEDAPVPMMRKRAVHD